MKISTAESVVMEALWRRSPLTSEAIIAEVGAPQDWTEGTVKVLISLLLKKKAITATAVEEPVQQALALGLDIGLAPLVSYLSDGDKLSDQDIAELKALIEKIGK